MNGSLKRVSTNLLLYLPAKVAEGLISVFTLSFLTDLFSKSVNDVFVIITTTTNMAYIILFAWLANSSSRYVGDYLLSADGNKQKAFYTSMTLPYMAVSVAAALVCLSISWATGSMLPFLSFFLLFGNASFQIFSAILVQTERRTAYVIISLCDAACKLLLIAVLGYSGLISLQTPAVAILAYAITDIAAFIAAAAVCGFFPRLSLRSFSWNLSKIFFIYGFPLIGVSLSVALLNMAYRYLLPAGTLAVFTYNASIATAIFTMITISLMRSVYPSILKAYRENGGEEAQRVITFGLRNYLLISVPAFTGLTAVSADLSPMILHGSAYNAGVPVIGLAALAMLFSGLTEYANKGWELQGDTRPILVNCMISALYNIAANLICIPLFGFLAAGVNLLLSYILYFLLSYIRSRRILKLALPRRNLCNILAAGLLCGGAAYAATWIPIPRTPRLAVAVIAGGLVYAAVLWLSGEIRAELRGLLRLAARRLHRSAGRHEKP